MLNSKVHSGGGVICNMCTAPNYKGALSLRICHQDFKRPLRQDRTDPEDTVFLVFFLQKIFWEFQYFRISVIVITFGHFFNCRSLLVIFSFFLSYSRSQSQSRDSILGSRFKLNPDPDPEFVRLIWASNLGV